MNRDTECTELADSTSGKAHGHVRPTIRCLLEDLRPTIGAGEMREALKTAEADLNTDALYLFPNTLDQLRNSVLDKANSLANDPNADRMRIKAITDRHVIKVKTGPHRAAMWRDEDGQWWLLAAGRRRDDGPDDFYRELEKYGNDSSPIAPTQRDKDYLRFETEYSKELELERTVHARVLQALLGAASTPGEWVSLEAFGAQVGLRIEPDEDGLAVVEVTWRMVDYADQQRLPVDLLAMIPAGQNIDDWACLKPRDSGMDQLWHTYVTEVWVENLAVSAELDLLEQAANNATAIDPVSDGSENFSHWAKGSVVTRAYIEGIEIMGLCGARVVAHRDYEELPVCDKCNEAFALLRKLRAASES